MTHFKVSLLIFLSFYTAVAMGQQKIESKFGKGVYVIANDSSFSMKFNARVQSLLMFEAPANELNAEGMTSNWLIRRSRLKFSGFAYSTLGRYCMVDRSPWVFLLLFFSALE